MVNVPTNTFVGGLTLPPGSPVTLDPYQFAGAQISLQTSLCPQPFGNQTGLQYCPASCVNSCPNLNPSQASGTLDSIDQLQTIIDYLNPALQAANQQLTTQTTPVSVQGSVSFSYPSYMQTAALQAVIQAIEALSLSNGFSVALGNVSLVEKKLLLPWLLLLLLSLYIPLQTLVFIVIIMIGMIFNVIVDETAFMPT
jgi:hypothetical protein